MPVQHALQGQDSSAIFGDSRKRGSDQPQRDLSTKKLRHIDSMAAQVRLLRPPCSSTMFSEGRCMYCALLLAVQGINAYGSSRLEVAPLDRFWYEASKKTNWLPYHTELADVRAQRQGIAISKLAQSLEAAVERLQTDEDCSSNECMSTPDSFHAPCVSLC